MLSIIVAVKGHVIGYCFKNIIIQEVDIGTDIISKEMMVGVAAWTVRYTIVMTYYCDDMTLHLTFRKVCQNVKVYRLRADFKRLTKSINVKLNKILSDDEHKTTAWSEDVKSETILKCISAEGFLKNNVRNVNVMSLMVLFAN